MKKCLLLLTAVLFLILALGGQGARAAEAPAKDYSALDLSWLDFPAPQSEQAAKDDHAVQTKATAGDKIAVDLWLDASPSVAGINTALHNDFLYNNDALTTKYVEGGFQYRFQESEKSTLYEGWYITLLQTLNSAARTAVGGRSGDRGVRVLRYSDEALSREFLAGNVSGVNDLLSGLLPGEQASLLSSVRRDMMLYAVNPTADTFRSMFGDPISYTKSSASEWKTYYKEKKTFYNSGANENAYVVKVETDDLKKSYLSNPELADAMAKAEKEANIQFAQGNTAFYLGADDAGSLFFEKDDPGLSGMYGLRYALENMDYSHLNIITCDTINFPVESDMNGITETLQRYRVFQQGLSVAVLGVRLDYIGFVSAVGETRLNQAMRWGKTMKSNNGAKILCQMPRRMLVLMIGSDSEVGSLMAQLTDYSGYEGQTLTSNLLGSDIFGGKRGVDVGSKTIYNDELAFCKYVPLGQQQAVYPVKFTFDYKYLYIHSNKTVAATAEKLALVVDENEASDKAASGYALQGTLYDEKADTVTAVLAGADVKTGVPADHMIDVTVTVSNVSSEDVKKDGFTVTILESLLFDQTLPLTRDLLDQINAQETGGQYQYQVSRDRVYRYLYSDEASNGGGAFSVADARLNGDQMTIRLSCAGASLLPGLYRVGISLATTGSSDSEGSSDSKDSDVKTEQATWYGKDGNWNFSLVASDVDKWNKISASTAYLNKKDKILYLMGFGESPIEEVTPDVLPVDRLVNLTNLIEQIKEATKGSDAKVSQLAVFDVFVSNRKTAESVRP